MEKQTSGVYRKQKDKDRMQQNRVEHHSGTSKNLMFN